jgi:hypothetical protein
VDNFTPRDEYLKNDLSRSNSRILKILGCKYGCHEGGRGASASVPSSYAGNGVSLDALRSRGVGLLSRLLWYDKRQFRQFLRLLVDSRDIQVGNGGQLKGCQMAYFQTKKSQFG